MVFWCGSVGITAQNQDKDLAAIVNGVASTRAEVEEAIAPHEQMIRHQLRNDPQAYKQLITNNQYKQPGI